MIECITTTANFWKDEQQEIPTSKFLTALSTGAKPYFHDMFNTLQICIEPRPEKTCIRRFAKR